MNRKVSFEDVQFSLITLIAITLPFAIKINSICIVLLVCVWIAGFMRRYNSFRKENNRIHFLIVISLFIIYIIGLSYSTYVHSGLKELETKLPLVIFPLVLYSIPKLDMGKIRIVLLSFVAANLIACFYCLLFLFIEKDVFNSGFQNIYPWDFINGNFTDPIGIHPMYLSCYLDFSLAIIFWELSKNQNLKSRSVLIGFSLITLSLIIFNLFAMSRMGLVIMIILFVIFSYHLIIRMKMLRMTILIFVGIAVAFIIMININNTFKERALTVFSEQAVEGSFNQRREIWYSSFSLFKKNFLFGVGTGDVKDELTKEYAINNYTGEYYNCHNEYLQTGNAIGLWGLLILLFAIGIPLLDFKNSIFLYFIIIIIMGFLTESMLSTQKGAVFYAYFYSIFAFATQWPENPNN